MRETTKLSGPPHTSPRRPSHIRAVFFAHTLTRPHGIRLPPTLKHFIIFVCFCDTWLSDARFTSSLILKTTSTWSWQGSRLAVLAAASPPALALALALTLPPQQLEAAVAGVDPLPLPRQA